MARRMRKILQFFRSQSPKRVLLLGSTIISLVGRPLGLSRIPEKPLPPAKDDLPKIFEVDDDVIAKLPPGALRRVLLQLRQEGEVGTITLSEQHSSYVAHGSHSQHSQHTSHHSHGQHQSHSSTIL